MVNSGVTSPALKPGGQRQNCQDKFQRPVICIYLFPMKYRFHQIRSKAAIPSSVQKQEQNAKDNTDGENTYQRIFDFFAEIFFRVL